MVNFNRKVIEIFEATIKAKLDEIWGAVGEEVAANTRKDGEIEDQDITKDSISADELAAK